MKALRCCHGKVITTPASAKAGIKPAKGWQEERGPE
jgi:hypothetical protein